MTHSKVQKKENTKEKFNISAAALVLASALPALVCIYSVFEWGYLSSLGVKTWQIQVTASDLIDGAFRRIGFIIGIITLVVGVIILAIEESDTVNISDKRNELIKNIINMIFNEYTLAMLAILILIVNGLDLLPFILFAFLPVSIKFVFKSFRTISSRLIKSYSLFPLPCFLSILIFSFICGFAEGSFSLSQSNDMLSEIEFSNNNSGNYYIFRIYSSGYLLRDEGVVKYVPKDLVSGISYPTLRETVGVPCYKFKVMCPPSKE